MMKSMIIGGAGVLQYRLRWCDQRCIGCDVADDINKWLFRQNVITILSKESLVKNDRKNDLKRPKIAENDHKNDRNDRKNDRNDLDKEEYSLFAIVYMVL